MIPDPLVLVVDDVVQNVRLLEAVLSPKGFRVATASSGEEALDALSKEHPDLVLLDILMPGMDGYEVCRRIREDPGTAFLPVIMMTASGEQEKIRAIESGADDFVNKPFDQAELLARVRSLVRVKRYHDTIERQAAELAGWNRELEHRVQDQIEQLERVGRLRRFLPAQLADLIISSGDESFLNAHRREITVVCCDLRGFTAFAESAEPEDVWEILGEYNGALGDLIGRFEGTLERFTGDGLVVFFNDPIPCDDAPLRSVRMALTMRQRVQELADGWHPHGGATDEARYPNGVDCLPRGRYGSGAVLRQQGSGRERQGAARPAKMSFVKKCKRDVCGSKAVSAEGKPLHGAAKNSFMTKCMRAA